MIIDYLAVGLAASLTGLLRILPNRVAFLLAMCCISLLRIFMPRISEVARINCKLVFPNKSDKERQRIIDLSWRVLAKHLVDFSRIPDLTIPHAHSLFDIDAFENTFAEIKSRYPNVGILLPTAHFGSFELSVQAFAVNGHPVTILARDFALPRLTQWWNKRREHFGCKVIGRKGGYREIVENLRNNNGVTVLFDQNVKANHAVFVDFFGHQVATTRALALAALRTGAPILFLVAANDIGGPYQLFYEEVLIDRDSSDPIDIQVAKITQAMNDCVARAIIERPEQWFWIHRRFKTRPLGEPENFY